eukprot:scaffold2146_cov145-Isochrysis_galbana.AAC.4
MAPRRPVATFEQPTPSAPPLPCLARPKNPSFSPHTLSLTPTAHALTHTHIITAATGVAAPSLSRLCPCR